MDEFTKRMAEKSKARREMLSKQMSETSPRSNSLKRRALAESQVSNKQTRAEFQLPDDVSHVVPSDTKRRLAALAQQRQIWDTDLPTTDRSEPVSEAPPKPPRSASPPPTEPPASDAQPTPAHSNITSNSPVVKAFSPASFSPAKYSPVKAPTSYSPAKPAATHTPTIVSTSKVTDKTPTTFSPSRSRLATNTDSPGRVKDSPIPAVSDRKDMWEQKLAKDLSEGAKLLRPAGFKQPEPLAVPPEMRRPTAADAAKPPAPPAADVIKRPAAPRLNAHRPTAGGIGPGRVDLNMSVLPENDPLKQSLTSRCNIWEQRISQDPATPRPQSYMGPSGQTPRSTATPGRTPARPTPRPVSAVATPATTNKPAAESCGKVSTLSPSSANSAGVKMIHQQLERNAADWQENEISRQIKTQKNKDMAVIEQRWKNGGKIPEPEHAPDISTPAPAAPTRPVEQPVTSRSRDPPVTVFSKTVKPAAARSTTKPALDLEASLDAMIQQKQQPVKPVRSAANQPAAEKSNSCAHQPTIVTHEVPGAPELNALPGNANTAAADDAALRMLALINGQTPASPIVKPTAIPSHLTRLQHQDSERSLNSAAGSMCSVSSLQSDVSSDSFAFSEPILDNDTGSRRSMTSLATDDDIISEYGATTDNTMDETEDQTVDSSSSSISSEPVNQSVDAVEDINELLDEAMDRLESPPADHLPAAPRHVTFQNEPAVREITPANSTFTESESEVEMRRPRPLMSQLLPEENEADISLAISLDAYRQSKYTSPQAAVVRKSVQYKSPAPEPCSGLDESVLSQPPARGEINAKIQYLHGLVQQEQNVITQTSNALSQCKHGSQFAGSQEEVECNRLLLLSCQKRRAYLSEMEKLKSQPEAAPRGARGSLAISDLRLPLKDSFLQKRSSANDTTMHYFLCLVRNGPQVIATQMLGTHDPNVRNTLDFCNIIQLHDIRPDFRFDLQVYGMSISREEQTTPKKKKAFGTPKKLFGSSAPKSTPLKNQAPAVHTTQFTLISSLPITMDSLGRSMFNLERVPFLCPLQGSIHMRLKCCMQSVVEHRGFLTMFDDVSGFGAWHRRWFALHGTQIACWKYPDDERRKEPLNVWDLKSCVTKHVDLVPRDVCARPHTVELVTVRPQQRGDRTTLVTEARPDKLTSVKLWLSADTKDDRLEWCRKLNKALTNIRQWNTDSSRAVSAPRAAR